MIYQPLCSGAYLYRRDRKKRVRKTSGSSSTDPTRVFRLSSEDGSSCSTTVGREEFGSEDIDTESYSSSVESNFEEERVHLKLSERFKSYLELDYEMITNNNKLVNLPAKLPVVTILENFVKHATIKSICYPNINDFSNNRRRNPASNIKSDKEYEKLQNSISLRQETADGLRIYFDLTLNEYLLYPQERGQAKYLLSEDYLKNFTYVASERPQIDLLLICKSDTPNSELGSECQSKDTDSQPHPDNTDNSRRRLRSYKNEETEFVFDIGLNRSDSTYVSIAGSTSSGSSTPAPTSNNSLADGSNLLKNTSPINIGITTKGKEILQKIISWQLIPSNAPAEPSMIYGGIHLARLIVKLPEFINRFTMSDNKLRVLLEHLDSFIDYLESRKELFGEHNYKDFSDYSDFTLKSMDTDSELLLDQQKFDTEMTTEEENQICNGEVVIDKLKECNSQE